MKKLMIIAAFLVSGIVVNAQNAQNGQNATSGKPKQEASATIQNNAGPSKETNVSTATTTVNKDSEKKETDKKECTSEEKKSCGDMKNGKSCCAPKAKP